LGKNNDVFLPVLFGVLRSGVVLVPLNWRLTAAELGYQLRDSRARLLFCDPEFLLVATQAIENNAEAPAVIMTEGEGALREMLQQHGVATSVPHDQNQGFLQIYTSGTTGQPKGVLISHYAVSLSRHAELSHHACSHLMGGCTVLSGMPNSHIGGISWVLMCLIRFGTVVLTADLSPRNIIDLVGTYRVEHTFIVPTVLRAVVDEIKRTQESPPRLRGIFYGAMAMSESLLRESLQLFGCAFVQFFGMTELSGSVTVLGPNDHDFSRPTLLQTVGRPYPGFSLEIRGQLHQVLARGEPGEIWIKSPTLMLGYVGLPEKTAEAVIDGWYASGDGGFLNSDGFLRLTDRIKDMIVSGGENVYPAEVEEALRRHIAVLDAAVVAVPHERWGEAVAAAIELRPGQSVTEEELMQFARGQVAAFKCPKNITFVERLPRTVAGKIQRNLVRADMRNRVGAKL
jgi:acyl-CoA synthetase (AMP-forming)/AMP-acid ligase II